MTPNVQNDRDILKQHIDLLKSMFSGGVSSRPKITGEGLEYRGRVQPSRKDIFWAKCEDVLTWITLIFILVVFTLVAISPWQ